MPPLFAVDGLKRSRLLLAAALLANLVATLLAAQTEERFPSDLAEKIQYVIVLYTENRSFDSVYGKFSGANGLAQAKAEQIVQTNAFGRPLPCLPQPFLDDTTDADPRFPPTATQDRFEHDFSDLAAPPPYQKSLANHFFDADRFAALDAVSGDMIHRFYTEQYQLNSIQDPKNAGGAPMSKFVIWSDNPGLVMGYYDVTSLGEAQLAKAFTLCDNVFHSAFGGSFLNHFWLIAARTPVWPRLDSSSKVKPTRLDPLGFPEIEHGKIVDGPLTNDPSLKGFSRSNTAANLNPTDYWAVNTLQPLQGPSDEPPSARLPMQEFDTIGDRLTARDISWAWFSGGWNDAKAGQADPLFQYHHQPFAYFKRYALATAPVEKTRDHAGSPGTDSPASAHFLKDEKDFRRALSEGTLPQVSFVKPLGESSGHPGQSSILSEQEWVAETIAAVQKSHYWPKVAIFVIPDENGGLWDHVPPPKIDCWGPGTRIPLIIVSPYAKRDFVDHTRYETVSILKFIELRWNLAPLNERDANATAPLNAFALSRP